jgi:hypothetical protein
VTSPLDGLTVDSPSGLTLSSTGNIVTLNARLSRGTVANSNKITLGTGAASAVQTVMGKAGLGTTGGSYDTSPTFNLGTGAYTVSYQTEGGARTTGFEIPGTRSVTNAIVNNANGVTLSGGNLTVSGTLTLTSGNVTTGASTLAIGAAGTVSRTSGHIVGKLQKNVATGSNVSRTFEIGTGGDYAPVTVLLASVTGAGNLTATTTAGDHPNVGTSGLNTSKTVNRYWNVTNSGVAFTTYSATLNFVATDVDAGPTRQLHRAQVRQPAVVGARGGHADRDQHAGDGDDVVQRLRGGRERGLAHDRCQRGGERHDLALGCGVGRARRKPDVHDDAGGLQPSAGRARGRCLGWRGDELHFHERHRGPLDLGDVHQQLPDHGLGGAHGTISPSGAVAVVCGSNQTFTITPDPNHHVLDVLVDGVSQGPVASYTFTNVTAAHTIAASFAIDNIISVATATGAPPPRGRTA